MRDDASISDSSSENEEEKVMAMEMTLTMRPPTVTLIRKMFDRSMSHLGELMDEMSSDNSDMEIGSIPLMRKLKKYVCFEKAQTSKERSHWISSVTQKIKK